MICTQCGTDNPEEANFCGSCGTSIGSAFDSPSGPITNLGGHGGEEENAEVLVTEAAAVEPPPAQAARPPSFSEPMPIPTHMPEPPPPPPPPQHQAPPPVNPNMPGAGIAPPPPVAGGYAPQQGQQGYGYAMPADGNTSGMGESYPVPPEAEGWTFGSFIPWGLFSFINGNNLWGILYWVSLFIPFSVIIYYVYVGLNGKKQAWQGRRFDDMQQYVDTMKAWNTWGLVIFVFNAIGIGIYGLLLVIGIFAGVSEEMGGTGF